MRLFGRALLYSQSLLLALLASVGIWRLPAVQADGISGFASLALNGAANQGVGTINLTGDYYRSGGLLGIAGAPPSMANMKYVPVVGANLAIGDTDLYTVPASRAALIGAVVKTYNPSGGSITFNAQIKVGGVYYRTAADTTLTTGVAGAGNPPGIMVLNAGESLSVHTATTIGLNFRTAAIEFDASDTRIATSRNLALASGANTLYTVPAGKSAVLLPGGPQQNLAGLAVVANNTGGSLNYYWNVVPNGGVADSTNQLFAASAVGDKAATSFSLPVTMAAGDVLSVNSSGADAGSHQIAWVTYYQF